MRTYICVCTQVRFRYVGNVYHQIHYVSLVNVFTVVYSIAKDIDTAAAFVPYISPFQIKHLHLHIHTHTELSNISEHLHVT